jgi:hypothetical protein
MKIYFSEEQYGFYLDAITPVDKMPDDAVEITEEFHQEAIVAISKDKRLSIVDGEAVLVDGRKEAVLPTEMKAVVLRDQRDILLAKTDGLVARHRDEKEEKAKTTLSATQFADLQSYRKELRNITNEPGFPDVQLPEKPDFLQDNK